MVDFAKSLFNFSGFHGNNANNSASQGQRGGDQTHQIPSGSSTTATSNTMASGQIFNPGSAAAEQPVDVNDASRKDASAAAVNGSGYYEQTYQLQQQPDSQQQQTASFDHQSNKSSNSSATVQIGGVTRHSDGSGTDTLLDDNTSPPIGTLVVRIMEARNLLIRHTNCCPYVVCTFDTSQYISHGPSGSIPNSTFAPQASGSIAIPSKSRQSSNLTLHKLGQTAGTGQDQTSNSKSAAFSPSNPLWEEEAQFDVTSNDSVLSITIYDANNNDAFMGQASFRPNLSRSVDLWLPLQGLASTERVSGEVRVSLLYKKVSKKQYGPNDFEVLRLVGKGTFGKVYQVRKKDTTQIYAMKVLSKKAIVQKREIAHTISERNILVRTSSSESSFIVGLKFSFQTPTDLYLVTDYMSGGELFWHLQKEGRFSERRAKFYIAELIVALENLHDNGIVYRDLKPENILLDANGHVALCDFGLSKANLDDGTTNTFCGTTEYLAPEVLLDDQGYTKMVDFWSLGVLVFEMCCGWSPFYAEDNQQMYKNIAFGKVRFPKDALSPEGRNFVKGLLNRNPRHRLGAINDARELKAHPFFADVDWDLLIAKKIPPPFKPHVSSETDTSNFDPEFTQTSTSILNKGMIPTSGTPLSPGIQANFKGFTYVDDSLMEEAARRANPIVGSYRPKSGIQRVKEDDIDLYDDNDINMSKSYYNESSISQRYGEAQLDNDQDDEHVREQRMDDDEDVQMDDDEHEFVNAQGFEM